MTVELTGLLRCGSESESALVREHLPLHMMLTRAEAGCIRFDVVSTTDPMVWSVHEVFATQADFDAHQSRTRASAWGQATAGIAREYTVTTHV